MPYQTYFAKIVPHLTSNGFSLFFQEPLCTSCSDRARKDKFLFLFTKNALAWSQAKKKQKVLCMTSPLSGDRSPPSPLQHVVALARGLTYSADTRTYTTPREDKSGIVARRALALFALSLLTYGAAKTVLWVFSVKQLVIAGAVAATLTALFAVAVLPMDDILRELPGGNRSGHPTPPSDAPDAVPSSGSSGAGASSPDAGGGPPAPIRAPSPSQPPSAPSFLPSPSSAQASPVYPPAPPSSPAST